jgi:hypothetical protein
MLLPELTKVNFSELGYDYDVPILFLEETHDPYTPSRVAKDYFDKVNAPEKEFVGFEKSGHFPFVKEQSKLTKVPTQKVLPLGSSAPREQSTTNSLPGAGQRRNGHRQECLCYTKGRGDAPALRVLREQKGWQESQEGVVMYARLDAQGPRTRRDS